MITVFIGAIIIGFVTGIIYLAAIKLFWGTISLGYHLIALAILTFGSLTVPLGATLTEQVTIPISFLVTILATRFYAALTT